MKLGLTVIYGFAVVQCVLGIDCSQFGEATCESANGDDCYWASQLQVPSCKSIPVANEQDVCVCTLPGGCGSNLPGGSGCAPLRFCAYLSDSCQVVNVVNDDFCVEDGSDTDKCVPTDYCTEEFDTLTGFLTCRWNNKVLPTPPPFTAAPTTRKPTRVPTKPPSKPDSASTVSVGTIAGAATGGAVLLFGCGFYYCFCMGSNKSSIDHLLSDSKMNDAGLGPGLKNIPVGELAAAATNSERFIAVKPGSPPVVKRPSVDVELEVTFDFEGENDDELTVTSGTLLTGIARIDDDWWEARMPNGTTGLIPASYVKTIPKTPGTARASTAQVDIDVEEPDW